MLTHHFQKDYSCWGTWCAFPIHKGYYGKPAHHTGVSTLSWLLYGYLLNPQPAAPGQDALGLITLYPRPDEPISDPLQLYQLQPPYDMLTAIGKEELSQAYISYQHYAENREDLQSNDNIVYSMLLNLKADGGSIKDKIYSSIITKEK